MKNTINVRIAFSFKGEDYAPSMTVDLDELMKTSGNLPDFCPVLARQNNIDTYSYLYEVMESSEVCFDNATGLAVECLAEGRFDMPQFELLWRNQHVSAALQNIAKKYMSVNQMDEYPGLEDALFEAYLLGKDGR